MTSANRIKGLIWKKLDFFGGDSGSGGCESSFSVGLCQNLGRGTCSSSCFGAPPMGLYLGFIPISDLYKLQLVVGAEGLAQSAFYRRNLDAVQILHLSPLQCPFLSRLRDPLSPWIVWLLNDAGDGSVEHMSTRSLITTFHWCSPSVQIQWRLLEPFIHLWHQTSQSSQLKAKKFPAIILFIAVQWTNMSSLVSFPLISITILDIEPFDSIGLHTRFRTCGTGIFLVELFSESEMQKWNPAHHSWETEFTFV